MSTSGVVLILVLAGLMAFALITIWRKAGAGEKGTRRVLYLLSMVCLSYGVLAFIGPALSAAGGLSFLPASFEWPVGTVSGVVIDMAGRYIVPHEPSGRVQVYDRDKRFLRGWVVNAKGGAFKLRTADDDLFDVFTARGKRHFVFRSDGTLVKDNGSYSTTYAEVAPESKLTEHFDTPFFFLPLADPGTAWTLSIVGAFGLFSLNRTKPKPIPEPDRAQSEAEVKPPPDSAS